MYKGEERQHAGKVCQWGKGSGDREVTQEEKTGIIPFSTGKIRLRKAGPLKKNKTMKQITYEENLKEKAQDLRRIWTYDQSGNPWEKVAEMALEVAAEAVRTACGPNWSPTQVNAMLEIMGIIPREETKSDKA